MLQTPYPDAVKDLNIDIKNMGAEDLARLYKDLDRQVKKELLEGASWEEIKHKIDYLTDLSKELEKRNLPVSTMNDTPANFNFRKE